MVFTGPAGFDELWDPFAGGFGTVGSYYAKLERSAQTAMRQEYHRRLGLRHGPFSLGARSWAVRGVRR